MDGIGSVTVTIAHLTMSLWPQSDGAIVQHGVEKLPTLHRREPSIGCVLVVSDAEG